MSSKSSKTDPDTPIAIGTISKVHGVRGAFIVAVDPSMKHSIRAGAVLQLTPQGATADASALCPTLRLTVDSVSEEGPGVRLLSEEIRSREQAERLLGATVSIDRDSLPDLRDAEFYDVDIVGARVSTETGIEVGVLSYIIATGANDVYVIRGDDGSEVLIPAVTGSVLSVDTQARRIVIDHRLVDKEVANR